MKLIIRLLVFCTIFPIDANAQGYLSQWRENTGDLYIGFATSTSRYCGDLNERYNIAHLQLGWGVSGLVQYRIDEYLSLRVDAGLTQLRGDQQYTKNKLNNLSFSSVNSSVSAGLRVDFRSADYPQYNIPYAWLSFGVTSINPTTLYNGQRVSLIDLKTENVDYAGWAGLIAYGVGMPFRVNKNIQIRLEGRYTHVLSDYLDDVSTVYVDKSSGSFLAQKLADRRLEVDLVSNRIGTQRGDPNYNDGYFLLSLQVVYKN
ncbi:outer membrane beta-barrel protein [Fibrella sp. HMF5335]|uniref:Outer membrane beta-barrel protein n=1 Tax=Fibrella rubiginis TaxID=2817060 RepID=A0A939K5R3_9BACT|nr:outer membrane beta-barrel protein [Fibrella rubiginis]MBO0936745.1 outer membrane beta-barrel protein [Fibrella rubiginis]